MLYETLKQSVIFLSMLYFGLLGGVLYEMKTSVGQPFLKNKYITILFDIVFFIVLSLLFFFATQFTNYGEIRLYMIVSFILGFTLERISIGRVLAKSVSFLYNKTVKKLKTTKLFKGKHKNEEVHSKISS